MVRRLLACWGILALLCAWGAGATERDHPYYQDLTGMHAQLSYPGVHFTWSWQDCGQVNAFYSSVNRHIVMCNELVAAVDPGAIRFIFAHEAGHAVIRQLNLPYTGMEETAADEFALYFLGLTGRHKDVTAAAEVWKTLARPENPFDEHPSDLRRYATYMTAMAGRAGWGCCVAEWRRIVWAWNRLLGIQ